MNPQQILQHCLDNLADTILVESWGEKGIFYNPGYLQKRGTYVLTIKEKNGNLDMSSCLDRKGVSRVNMGLRNSTFQKLFGQLPVCPAAGEVVTMDYDFTAQDI